MVFVGGSPALEDDVVEALGAKMHIVVERGRQNRASAAIQLLCVLAELVVVGQVFHTK